jgi:Zn-dependent protease with chaperone function/type II secretory pathway pseudopilin PulG
MNKLVYPRERTLGAITLVLGILVWLGLIVGTFGVALGVLAVGFILYLFAQSALISHLKGNGVELSETQFPDLYSQFTACCDRLQITKQPKAYILNGDGGMNAFATKFLGTQYVVLLSDIVDAMDEHPDGVRFYIGHELGHLRMKHLSGNLLRWPVLWLPLLGAAYSRARESTCDRHGLACSKSHEGAARALAALAAGSERWKKLDVVSYIKQANQSSSFWMSFHELIAGYPWVTKRAARVMDTKKAMPKRNGFAYILALFVPYAGRLGAGFGLIIMIYIVGVLAAIAVPAYVDYTAKAKVDAAFVYSMDARETLSDYYEANQDVPESLDAVGINSELADGSQMSLDPEYMVLTISMEQGDLIFTPRVDEQGNVIWYCSDGEGLKPSHLPASCRVPEEE